MTYPEAMCILTFAAAAHARGRGKRLVPSELERARIKGAIEKLWPKMYGRPASQRDLRNLGF